MKTNNFDEFLKYNMYAASTNSIIENPRADQLLCSSMTGSVLWNNNINVAQMHFCKKEVFNAKKTNAQSNTTIILRSNVKKIP